MQARCCPQGTRAPAQQRSPAVRSCRPGPFPGTSPAHSPYSHSPSLADIGPLANHTGGAARPLSSKGELTGSWVFGGVTAGSNQGQRREKAFLLPRGLRRQHPSTLAERGEVAQEGKGWEQALEDSIWQEEGSECSTRPARSLGCLVGGVQHLLRSTSTPVSMLCYDTKHRYFSQDAQTSQTKPLRKPNVQNKIMYTRLAPALHPARLALLGVIPRGWGGEEKQLAKDAECPNHTHTQGVPATSTQGQS